MKLNAMIENLSDFGFSEEQKKTLKIISETGTKSELIRYLKKYRCILMDEMHESQRKVDRMDYLIRKVEKEA